MNRFIFALLILLTATAQAQEPASVDSQTNFDWKKFAPVDPTPESDEVLELKVTSPAFLSTKDIMRRDPSDVIRVEDTYYVWYTKIAKGTLEYDSGWLGTVWYATSQDGYEWEEQGQALDKGAENAWDGVGVYTPNILVHEGKYYLAYTAMRLPFDRQHSQASIGMAVSGSPDGPWTRLPNNPVIKPGEAIDAPDGFLCDDTVFVVRDDKIWLYYKGYPRTEKEGVLWRVQRTTFTLGATADRPEGPYEKIPKVLHRGHEAVLWKDVDSVGSLCTNFGPNRYYKSEDGINFKSIYAINPLMAVGLYRADFEEGNEGTRATWGVAMELKDGNKTKGGGLQRFEFVWPE